MRRDKIDMAVFYASYNGGVGYVYKNQDAFYHNRQEICYISEHSFERLGEPIECGGNIRIPKNLIPSIIENGDAWTYNTLYREVASWVNKSKNEKISVSLQIFDGFIRDFVEIVFNKLDYQSPTELLEIMNFDRSLELFLKKETTTENRTSLNER